MVSQWTHEGLQTHESLSTTLISTRISFYHFNQFIATLVPYLPGVVRAPCSAGLQRFGDSAEPQARSHVPSLVAERSLAWPPGSHVTAASRTCMWLRRGDRGRGALLLESSSSKDPAAFSPEALSLFPWWQHGGLRCLRDPPTPDVLVTEPLPPCPSPGTARFPVLWDTSPIHAMDLGA